MTAVVKGQLAELLENIDRKVYWKYVVIEKVTKVLYTRINKALYGFFRSGLLFDLKLVIGLKLYGFKLNLYDPCVAYKMVNGERMNFIWHIDDLEVSHKDSFEITRFAMYLSKIYR